MRAPRAADLVPDVSILARPEGMSTTTAPWPISSHSRSFNPHPSPKDGRYQSKQQTVLQVTVVSILAHPEG
jgi:hypothetical protein